MRCLCILISSNECRLYMAAGIRCSMFRILSGEDCGSRFIILVPNGYSDGDDGDGGDGGGGRVGRGGYS